MWPWPKRLDGTRIADVQVEETQLNSDVYAIQYVLENEVRTIAVCDEEGAQRFADDLRDAVIEARNAAAGEDGYRGVRVATQEQTEHVEERVEESEALISSS